MSDETSTPDEGTDSEGDKRDRPNAKPYQDEERLRELYHGEDLTQREVAEHFDVSVYTINKWINRFDIETPPSVAERERSRKPIYSCDIEGGKKAYYERTDDGSQYLVSRHQLVALLKFRPELVFHDGVEIHHILGAPMALDVADNLIPLEQGNHQRRHKDGTANPCPPLALPEIFDGFDTVRVNPDVDPTPSDEDDDPAIDSDAVGTGEVAD